MRAIYIVCMIALLGAMMVAPAAATTWDVYPGDSIQNTINNASDGDTIFVHAGIYYELSGQRLYINKPNIILRGEGADVVTLDRGGSNNYIAIGVSSPPLYSLVSAPGCIVEGFRIINCSLAVCVYDYAPNCIIRNNVVEDIPHGVSTWAPNTTFIGNVILNPEGDLGGISILSPASGCTIVNNVVSGATGSFCAVNIEADDCIIVNNTIESSPAAGISLNMCANNTITRNNIISHEYAGIELYDAGEGNKIYLNNFVDNGVTATTTETTPPSVTYWNSTEPITYTHGSTTHTNYLGNYWDSDYTGSDSDGDGLGDTSYVVPEGIGDDYCPLMEPFENYLGEGAADPDLTPTSIAADSLNAGVPAAITVDVSNIGSAEAGSFTVTLKVEDTVIGNDTVTSLGAGSSVPVVFTWTPDAAGSFNLTAIADSEDAVAESDEANNELTKEVTVTPAAATTWYVHDGESIWDTINSATDGDTVFVYNGTYGVFAINKPNITLIGEGADVVTVDCGGTTSAIGNAASASGCVVDGFKIVNSDHGIEVYSSCPNCIIRNCVFESPSMMISLGAINTTFMGNVVSNSTYSSRALDITRNGSTIINNTIINSVGAAILPYIDAQGPNSVISGNNLISNGKGIWLHSSYVYPGYKIYLNNFVDNTENIKISGTLPLTYFNSTSPIEYTYNGSTYTGYLGNYWSDYGGVDTTPEDGIGDSAYQITTSTDYDYQPLMTGFENYLGEEAAAPDLTPTSIATDSLSAGVPAAITVDVSNIGSAEAGSFNVTLKVEETVIGSDTVASLGTGGSVPVVFTWTPDAAGTFNLTAIVDSDDAVAESDEANNELTREVTVEEQSTPTPPTSFLISGNITYDNGNPVMNPAVTVTNLATSEDFTVKTDAGSNFYLTLTDSTHVTAGEMIRINTSDGTVSNETDHPVTASGIETGGFGQDMTIESGELPDLTVTEKSEEWISLADGTYNVTCTVANIGTSGADASTTAIEIDGDVIANDSVPALAIGESHTSTLGPFTLSGENDTIRVCADSGESINELDETNNCLENVLEAPSMPDLIVWVALKTPGYVNEDNILGVRVKNTGTEDAGSFNVSLAIDGTPMPEQTVPPLAGGETTELEYAWTPTELGGHALSATVDTNNDVEESDETNNDYARTSVIIKRTDWHQFHYDEVHSGFSPSGAPDTNETLWISDELSAIGGTSTVVADGKVFAYGGPTSPYGSGEGVLYCLDEFTGAIIWNISIPTPAYGSWSSPAYHNGRVFTSTDIEAGCYDATTGEQIWAFENPTNEPSVNGGPIVADGKVIVNDWQEGHYYCLDEETGELLWTFTEEQAGSWAVGYTQGVPAYENGKFYLTTWIYIGGNVYCVDADTGDVIWNQTTPLDTCGSPTVVNGTVYVTNYNFYGDGAIYAMDATDGAIRWSQTIQRSDSTPAVAYGNVYVTGGCLGFSERQTYCFDAATGDLVWETNTADTIGAWTCSVAVADGKVFVGSEGGDFFDYAGTYALDAFTGDVIWSHPEGGSSPAVADNMVFTIGGGRIYAFCDPLPDLTVAAIATPANLRNDVINPISAMIENIGGSAAENFEVLLEVDGDQVDTATIATLAAGENVMVEFLWTPDATGGATFTVTADADNLVEELDETNNDLSETVDVLPKLTVTTNVRIEGKDDTVWTGDVTFSSSMITASDGSVHYLNEPTALGALDEADKSGGFGYVVESHPVYGLYISEVNNEPAIEWDGWMYRVNYVSPWVGAADYTLTDSDEVLWYFGTWTAPPLAIELSATDVSPGEEFVATVTAYNGNLAEFEPVDGAEVYIDGELYGLTDDGILTISIDTTGSYQIHADKGTWANYTRSGKKVVTVQSVESYGESVYAKKNTYIAWRALDEPDDEGAVLFRNAEVAIELEETIPACKDVSVRVVRLGFQSVNFDVQVSPDGSNWNTIGSETINSWMTWEEYDYDGDFDDVKYIRITKPGTRWKPRLMGLDSVYAKN